MTAVGKEGRILGVSHILRLGDRVFFANKRCKGEKNQFGFQELGKYGMSKWEYLIGSERTAGESKWKY